jgi:hypothetical protein
MPLLNSGSTYYEVEVIISDGALDLVEKAGDCPLNHKLRERLRELAFSWVERREMMRPYYRDVLKLLNELIARATRGREDRFFATLRTISLCDEQMEPASAYVYNAILAEMKISATEALTMGWCPVSGSSAKLHNWNLRVAGQKWTACIAHSALHQGKPASLPHIDDFRIGLVQVRSRLQNTYHGKRAGSRDHDLGWVIPVVAEIYTSAGGMITASSRFVREPRPNESHWQDDSNFIRFCKAFVDCLPCPEAARSVDVGRLVRRALRFLRAESSSKAKK